MKILVTGSAGHLGEAPVRGLREMSHVNTNRAREELGWRPRHDFASAIASLSESVDPRSALARAVGTRGFHAEPSADGATPLPVIKKEQR